MQMSKLRKLCLSSAEVISFVPVAWSADAVGRGVTLKKCGTVYARVVSSQRVPPEGIGFPCSRRRETTVLRTCKRLPTFGETDGAQLRIQVLPLPGTFRYALRFARPVESNGFRCVDGRVR